MKPKITQRSIWKIGIRQKLDIKDVEGVVGEAQKQIGKGFDALIERIDMKDNETNVFVSGESDSVETVEKAFSARLPKAKTTKTEVKKEDLLKPL
jgi:hypothetical protein